MSLSTSNANPATSSAAAGPGERSISPAELAERHAAGEVTIVDVREPVEFIAGHIAGSHNRPLGRLTDEALPGGPIVLVCQSGRRSHQGLMALLGRSGNEPATLMQLEGGLEAWIRAGQPLRRRKGAPLPLMRQVQIAAGSLVLAGVLLSQLVAPGWVWLSGFVGAGLIAAGISGFCGMARLLAAMPWNRVAQTRG
ncbi:rhodanese-like domain-containing protein [Synechococcus sp. RSCCF101]|uniref:rhodanese-like domain-containing protein n=1 Tax=Synechococcus sp. RSCCF101 TaxID=2511069 RepID=UPI0017806D46|nr:rhodanese-like domain-containing protein [Synechococcus sp. RSCCF101]